MMSARWWRLSTGSWAKPGEFRSELHAIFNAIRQVNFTIDWERHQRLLPQRHTLDSWTSEFAMPKWPKVLSGGRDELA